MLSALILLLGLSSILFGIRIALHPLSEVVADRLASERLARALRTMPEAVAGYKGLALGRGTILEWLAQA